MTLNQSLSLPVPLDKRNADSGNEIVHCSESAHKVTSEIYSIRVDLTVQNKVAASLVPRRSLLPRCPREVWERAGERTRSRRVSLGDVTAHGRVQD